MHRRKNIAIDVTPTVSSGGATYLRNIIPRLANLWPDTNWHLIVNVESHLLTNIKWGPNVIAHPFGFRQLTTTFSTGKDLVRSLNSMYFQQFWLPKWLDANKMDLLYAPHDMAPMRLSCPLVLAIRNSNPYFWFDINYTWYHLVKRKILRIFSKYSAIRASKVVFVSEYMRRKISSQLRIPEEKTVTIYHGVNESFFDHEGIMPERSNTINGERIKKPYILAVSTVAEHKNYEVLLRAVSKLTTDASKRLRLYVAGRRPVPAYYKKLVNLTRELGISKRISFLGEVTQENIRWLYSNGEVFVLPSYLETFGHPLVEAMATGIPVVASNSTAIPEIMGGAGLLFDPNNEQDLASSIESVLTSMRLRQILVQRGQERAKFFSWDNAARQTLETIGTVI